MSSLLGRSFWAWLSKNLHNYFLRPFDTYDVFSKRDIFCIWDTVMECLIPFLWLYVKQHHQYYYFSLNCTFASVSLMFFHSMKYHSGFSKDAQYLYNYNHNEINTNNKKTLQLPGRFQSENRAYFFNDVHLGNWSIK